MNSESEEPKDKETTNSIDSIQEQSSQSNGEEKVFKYSDRKNTYLYTGRSEPKTISVSTANTDKFYRYVDEKEIIKPLNLSIVEEIEFYRELMEFYKKRINDLMGISKDKA